jgi:hypothetical protein
VIIFFLLLIDNGVYLFGDGKSYFIAVDDGYIIPIDLPVPAFFMLP